MMEDEWYVINKTTFTNQVEYEGVFYLFQPNVPERIPEGLLNKLLQRGQGSENVVTFNGSELAAKVRALAKEKGIKTYIALDEIMNVKPEAPPEPEPEPKKRAGKKKR